MKQMIIWFAVIATILVGIMFWARPSGKISVAASSDAASPLVSSESIYDFGTISMADGYVSHTFKVTNPTDKDIAIPWVHTSCMCTTAFLETPTGEKGPFSMEGMGYIPTANDVIKAGETRDVKVVYNPNAHGPAGVGRIDRFVFLTDAAGSQFQLEIKALVTP